MNCPDCGKPIDPAPDHVSALYGRSRDYVWHRAFHCTPPELETYIQSLRSAGDGRGTE